MKAGDTVRRQGDETTVTPVMGEVGVPFWAAVSLLW